MAQGPGVGKWWGWPCTETLDRPPSCPAPCAPQVAASPVLPQCPQERSDQLPPQHPVPPAPFPPSPSLPT